MKTFDPEGVPSTACREALGDGVLAARAGSGRVTLGLADRCRRRGRRA